MVLSAKINKTFLPLIIFYENLHLGCFNREKNIINNLPSRNKTLAIADKSLKLRRNKYQSFCYFPIFAFFLYFVPLTFSMIVDILHKFSAEDSFSKCDQIRSFLRIWSHLLKKSLMENFIFCAVIDCRDGSENF